jgi:hypothetical protein
MWKAFVHYAQQQQQQPPSSISLQQSTRNLQALENWREQHFAHANIRTQELARSTLLFAICFCEHYYWAVWKFNGSSISSTYARAEEEMLFCLE